MKERQISSRKQVERKEAAGVAARMARSAGAPAAGDASARTRLNPADRRRLIAQAAYFRAERRGFAPGGELQDWIEAEAEIGRLLDS